MDNELRGLLEKLAKNIDEFNERLNNMEKMAGDIFGDYDRAQKKWEHDTKRADWDSKYGDKLRMYSDKAKAFKGDDFDLMEESMNEYYDSGMEDSDEYVNALIQVMDDKFKSIADALTGDAEADKEVVKEAAEEAVEETAEETAGEETAGDETKSETIVSDEETKEKVEEALDDGDKKEDVAEAEEKVDDKYDELDEFTKELEAEKERLERK